MTSSLAKAGAAVASLAPDAVTGAHVVIPMLPTAAVANSVIFGDGVAGASPEGCVWGQMGTIGATETLGIRDQLAARRPGVVIVDAPVSGSKDPAERGQLLILAFGPAAAADTVGPAFGIIGRKTVWLGEAGRGSQVKMVVNEDVDLALRAAGSADPALLAALSRQWHAAVDAGHGREDISAVRLVLRQPGTD